MLGRIDRAQLRAAYLHGADIVDNSLGGPGDEIDSFIGGTVRDIL